MSSSSDADRIRARTNDEARDRFFKFLSQSTKTVCTQAHWKAIPDPSGCWSALTMPDTALRLRTTDGGQLFLRSTIKFEYIDHPERPKERKVSTLYYAHSVTTDEALRDELFSWQWHPIDAEPSYPHVHVAGAKALGKALHKMHIPTGRVFLESVVMFLITDLGVVPVRDNWRPTLEQNLSRVMRYATWGAGTGS